MGLAGIGPAERLALLRSAHRRRRLQADEHQALRAARRSLHGAVRLYGDSVPRRSARWTESGRRNRAAARIIPTCNSQLPKTRRRLCCFWELGIGGWELTPPKRAHEPR